jgi:hypothetical protein
VRDATYDVVTEMDHLADDLREVSMKHGVCIAKTANVSGRYVHMAFMTRAFDKMDVVAEKLKNEVKTLRKAMSKESPPHEV